MLQRDDPGRGWLTRFSRHRPVLFSVFVILIAGLLTELPFETALRPLLGDPGAELFNVFAGHVIAGTLLVWLLVKLGLLDQARFTPPRQWKAVWLVWPLVLMAVLNLDSLIDGSLVIDASRPAVLVLYVCLNLSIGFVEEVMGRGVVLGVMMRKWGDSRRGIYRAVLVSSALFGVSHLFNLATGRLALLPALTQIGYSFSFGVVFAACFLRNHSIWPVIVMHAAVDLAGGLRHVAVGGATQLPAPNTNVGQVMTTLSIIAVPLLAYGLFILRKAAPPGTARATEVASIRSPDGTNGAAPTPGS